jgi:hypothetical protein
MNRNLLFPLGIVLIMAIPNGNMPWGVGEAAEKYEIMMKNASKQRDSE